MGQYWEVVNLDKKERICAHKLGVGLKLGEQVGSGHGSPDALFILVAAMRERRGGGDFDWDSNYYGPERDNSKPGHGIHGGPVIEDYNEVAKRTIGVGLETESQSSATIPKMTISRAIRASDRSTASSRTSARMLPA